MGPSFWQKVELKTEIYMTEFCDQTKVLDFLSDNGVWVMSYEFEL